MGISVLTGFILAISVVNFARAAENIEYKVSKAEMQELQKLDEVKKARPVLPKVPLPKDPRPVPKTESDWKKLKSMKDPLAKEESPSFTAKASIPWGSFLWGDIILGRGTSSLNSIPYGYYRHAATWDDSRNKLVSAMPNTGVHWETQTFWNSNYPRARALSVNASNYNSQQATLYAEAQLGEPWRLSSKSVSYSWYCSKLPWAGYKGRGVDIDANAGTYVTPVDIYYDGNTTTFFVR